VKITKGIIPNAEGSAMAELGDTKVLCGVKIDVMKPYADRPTEGVFTVQAEFLPLAHPEFESGPPKEGSIELSRVVDRGIRRGLADRGDPRAVQSVWRDGL
jgi:exosome complex component RRP42